MSTYVHIMSGIPASGKSTYATQHATSTAPVMHRDDLRAALRLKYNSDEYFPCSPEEEYSIWIEALADTIKNHVGDHIWVDQTTTNRGSSRKLMTLLLEKLKEYDYPFEEFPIEFHIEMMDVPFDVCKARNDKRIGYARVPDNIMESMNRQFHKYIDHARMSSVYLVKGYPVFTRIHSYEGGDTQQ